MLLQHISSLFHYPNVLQSDENKKKIMSHSTI